MKLSKILTAGSLSLLLIAAPVLSETLHLADGTRLTGKIVSMNNGVYTVDTSSLGRVRIKSSQVTSINSSNSTGGSSDSTNEFSSLQAKTFQSLQQAISQDKDAMTKIMQLQNDPLVQSILADTEIMNAVSRGDYGSLAENPKIQRLMKNQTVKSISRQYAQ